MLDFLFTAAQLWKDKNVFVGEWIRTIQRFEEKFFISKSGIFSKEQQLDRIYQLRWRINWARNFCNRKPEFQLLFPYQYFDSNRKESHEGGFSYTHRHFKRHLNNLRKFDEDEKISRKSAYQRKLNKRLTLKVREYVKGKRTFEKLVEYVERLEKKLQLDKGKLSIAMINKIEIERAKYYG